MGRTRRRIISLLLALVFALYVVPAQAFAAEPEDELLSEAEQFEEAPTDWPKDEAPDENEEAMLCSLKTVKSASVT